MKSLIENLSILFLILLSTAGSMAQDTDFDNSENTNTYQRNHFPTRSAGWWTLGINGGWAYQQSDVPTTFEGYGFGMTLAKNLYYRPGSAVSFDARGRWLYSQSIGLDTKRALGLENNTALNGTREAGERLDYTIPNGLGYVFQNNKTQQFELGLEGVLTANRLRERTGIIASLYGGINLDWYNVKLDQANNNGIYDYSSINPDDSKSSIKSILKNNVLDGNYETAAHGFDVDGKLKFMPSLGVELGYQVTPRFSVHVGHKATFAGTDDLDGEIWEDNNNVTAENDIHHYTNLGLQWIIDGKDKRMSPPIINLTQPRTNPYTTRTSYTAVIAKIKNVRSAADITCSVNGAPSSFSFNRGNFRVNTSLQYGNNEVLITAVNEVGEAQELVIIYYGDNSVPPVVNNNSYAPRVRITNPRDNSTNTDRQETRITAKVEYVNNKNDIDFLVNGRRSSDFSYNSRNDEFVGNVSLRSGKNEIEIIANNEVGNDRDNAVIFFEQRSELPEVNITTPARSPFETSQSSFRLNATVRNVRSKNDVKFMVNGRERSSFNYEVRSGKLSADMNLARGRNEVVIRVYNDAGEASDQATIILQAVAPPTIQRPSVNITSPNRNPFETEQNSINISAELRNVKRKSDVKFLVNGRAQNTFDYNARNGRFSANLNLSNGKNDVIIRGYNEAGDAQDQTVIFLKNTPTVQRPIVNITSPNQTTYQTTQRKFTLRASLQHVKSKEDIKFLVNGKKRESFSYNAQNGKLESNLTLANGNNRVRIEAKNESGSAQDEVTLIFKVTAPPTLSPPKVTINTPANNSTTKDAVVNLNARVKGVNRKNNVQVKLNGNSVSNFSFSPVSGVVTAKLTLKNGRNNILVWGKNNDGTDDESITVNLNAPRNPPIVEITQPNNNATTDTKTATVKAKVLNVSGKNDIQFSVNGRNVTNFNYSTSSKILVADITLKEGSNTVKIKATTADGTDSESIRINYTAPKVLPTVNITTPKNNATTEKASSLVKATIRNVKSKNDITFLLNGTKVTRFSFKRNILNATVNLKSGLNVIKIEGKNADGKAQAEVRINYRPAVVVIKKPEIKFTYPTKPGGRAKKREVVVTATVKNITQQNQIKVRANGKTTNFTFDNKKGVISIPVNLKNGTNKISIVATNEGGSANAETTLIFVARTTIKLKKPEISITSVSIPTTNPFNPTVSGSTILGKIQNISDKSQMTVLVNDSAVTDFTFDNRTKSFQINVKLVAGVTNKVKITAKNRTGTDVKEHTY